MAVPGVRVADPSYNAAQTVALIRQAAERKAAVVLFPELGLSAYSCEDVFHQRALLDASLEALRAVLAASAHLSIAAVVGLPLQVGHRLYNCAAVVHRGRLLGVVPKIFLPNYREFYEARQFTSGETASCACSCRAHRLACAVVPAGYRRREPVHERGHR